MPISLWRSFFGFIAGARFMIFTMAILAAGSDITQKRVLYTELSERKEG